MPAIDLRGIHVAEYVNTNGTITYNTAKVLGDAMNVNLGLKFAEGRLYAESALAEYLRKCIGGTISIGVKYIKQDVMDLMFGMGTNSRTVSGSSVSSHTITKSCAPKNVGVSFYAPDIIDGATKYTCVFVKRALFGMPDMVYRTASENIEFQTPTVTGEFMADHSSNGTMLETVTVDTETEATAWCAAVFTA